MKRTLHTACASSSSRALTVPVEQAIDRPSSLPALSPVRRSATSSLVMACLLAALLLAGLAQIITAPPLVVEVVEPTPPPEISLDSIPAEKPSKPVDILHVPPTPRTNVVPPPEVQVTVAAPSAIEIPLPPPADIPPLPQIAAIEFDSAFEDALEPVTPVKKTKKATPKKPSRDTTAETKRKAAATAARKAAATEKAARARAAKLASRISKQAQPTSRASPSYPKSARRKKLQGHVKITLTVSTSGKPTSCYVSSSSGHRTLDQAALKAAKKYRFSPAKNGLGQPIAVKKTIPFTFRLSS